HEIQSEQGRRLTQSCSVPSSDSIVMAKRQGSLPFREENIMKHALLAVTALAGLALSSAMSQAAGWEITVGLVMELTGPAGEYGQAGAKSVEMAFRDINDAGGVIDGCKLITATRARHTHGNV